MDKTHILLYPKPMLLNLRVKFLLAINLAILIINWILSVSRYQLSPDYIPLHYTVHFGFDRFGPRTDIFLFATLATAILGINFFILKEVFRKNEFWSLIFLGLTVFLQLVLLGAPLLVALKSLS